MAYPIAPPLFQGDLVDPVTGTRIYRMESWWEAKLRAHPAIQTPPAPVALAPEPPPTPKGGWSDRSGYYRNYPT
jgi:hypothetical protein